MRDKLNRFVDNTIGNFQEVSYRDAIYQCMDLVYEWVFVLDLPKATIQHEYAYQAYTEASDLTRQYFDIIKNETSTIPQEGDIVVFNKTSSNKAGHIAIVVEATQSIMKLYEQNNPLGTNANIHDRNYNNCLGFLRPKYSEPTEIPDYMQTLFNEAGIDKNNEGQFRTFWQKAVKYDGDIQSLQAQVKSANEALADRALEVSALTEKNQKLSDEKTQFEELNNTLRSDKDTLSYENAQLNIQVKNLSSENETLTKQVDDLKGASPLKGYSAWELIKAIFLKR